MLLLTTGQFANTNTFAVKTLLLDAEALIDSPDGGASAEEPGGFMEDGLSPDNAACIIYTSGSTGVPKGIMIPHRALVRLVRNTNYCSIGADDRVANLSSCAFDVRARVRNLGAPATLNAVVRRRARSRYSACARSPAEELKSAPHQHSVHHHGTSSIKSQPKHPAPSPRCA